jgi:hypothetical protein
LTRSLAITVGEGRERPQGRPVALESTAPNAIVLALRDQPANVERWWSPHSWARSYRLEAEWVSSVAAVVDVDYRCDPCARELSVWEARGKKGKRPSCGHAPTDTDRAALEGLALATEIPGSIFHHTPHGARVGFVYDAPVTDRDTAKRAERGAGALVAKRLAEVELFRYYVDAPLLGDLARFFYTPNCIVGGETRSAELITLAAQPWQPTELATHAPPDPVAAPVTSRPMPRTLEEAVERWNSDHPGDWPRHTGRCPVCNDSGSFGVLPNTDGRRWFCFSTDHPDGCGIRGEKGYHGDALDLDAALRGLKPIEVLRDDGYLPRERARRPAPEPPAWMDEGPPPEALERGPSETRDAAPVVDMDRKRRTMRSRSFWTAVEIVRGNDRGIFGGTIPRRNRLTGRIEFGDRELRDSDVHRARYLIEARFSGGQDKAGNEIGMSISREDLFSAFELVADENEYNPIEKYLNSLAWDNVPRLDSVCEDLLHADRSPLNQVLIRKFFISCVARALRPGEKVDTMLILVGEQGEFKSSWFKLLASPKWFLETPIDINNKDAYMQIRMSWICEWAELKSMFQAREMESVKAFLSITKDTFRPSHDRFVIDVERHTVFVGTTNQREFLIDETGERRFWPVMVGTCDLERTRAVRDQLWAEAVHRFRAGEIWHLTKEEQRWLEAAQVKHKVSDAWEDRVLSWASAFQLPFTTSLALEKAIDKPMGQWTKADEMRVSKILTTAGYARKSTGDDRKKRWVKA